MKRFKNILCVVEAGEPGREVLERAISLGEKNQAKLTVVEVVDRLTAGIWVPEGGPSFADLQATLVRTHLQKMEAWIAPYRKKIKIETKLLTGTLFLEIIREILRQDHDLLIKRPEAKDWLGRLFGSDDMHLLRKCPCPVWLIKPRAPKTYQRILVAIDVDDTCSADELETRRSLNRQILEMARSLAVSDAAELHIVAAWEAIGEKVMHGALARTPEEQIVTYVEQVRQHHEVTLDALVREMSSKSGREDQGYFKPIVHLLKGAARKEISTLAKMIRADLVVMGTVARTGIPGFIMGNTAETILNQIDCSVLAIKPPGFVTPVALVD